MSRMRFKRCYRSLIIVTQNHVLMTHLINLNSLQVIPNTFGAVWKFSSSQCYHVIIVSSLTLKFLWQFLLPSYWHIWSFKVIRIAELPLNSTINFVTSCWQFGGFIYWIKSLYLRAGKHAKPPVTAILSILFLTKAKLPHFLSYSCQTI